MSRKLTILFAPMSLVGHVNSCIGLGEALHNRGHKIVFIVSKVFEGKLEPYGFYEEILESKLEKKELKPGEQTAVGVLKDGILDSKPSIEKLKDMIKSRHWDDWMEQAKELEPQIKQIVAKHKPDVYIIDNIIGSPTLVYSDKPWVYLFSGNPLWVIEDERTPPGGSGYPSENASTSDECKKFKQLRDQVFIRHNLAYNEWLEEIGCPKVEKKMIPNSPYLSLYGYPKELDYTDIRPLPDKWMGVDTFMRKGEQGEFILPDKLKNRDEKKQKLIYLSLGSMGGAKVELMKRLAHILSKSPHKVIVSKGVRGDEYELADNMWGANSVPQTKVLPLVDLVITHGGNNTVTETFSFGKPMIVMPIAWDQFDNAQRVHEKGFGLRMDGHECTEQQLLEGIEKLLNDTQLKKRLDMAAERMATTDSLTKASEAIENLVN